MRIATLVLICCLVQPCRLKSGAQSATSAAASPEPAVLLQHLAIPVYPPLARQARIGGDVKIQLEIGVNGGVETAEIMSGHPLLKQAALDSAKKSTYACQGCTSKAPYLLTYTFGFRDDSDCPQAARKRSAKCLGLWKCGGWYSIPPRAPVIGELPGRVIVLADSACVETENADARSSR
jgi:TonB family protein